MFRFLVLCAVLIVTFLGFFFFPTVDGRSAETVAGMAVVCLGSNTPCWLTLGAGPGVVVVGMGGVGLVSFTLYGAGLLLGTGQVAAGGIAIGQAGFGASAFLGQIGVAPVARGQAVAGALVQGQGKIGMDGTEYLKTLDAEVNALLGQTIREDK